MRASEFVVENATAGATGSGSIATVAQPVGKILTKSRQFLHRKKYHRRFSKHSIQEKN